MNKCYVCGKDISDDSYICEECQNEHFKNKEVNCKYERDGECTLHLFPCNSVECEVKR